MGVCECVTVCVDCRMRNRCGSSCTSGSSMMNDDVFNCRAPSIPMSTIRTQPPSSTSVNSSQPALPPEVLPFHPTLNRGSVVSNASSASKPGGALSSLAGLIGDTSKECCSQRVQVMMLSGWKRQVVVTISGVYVALAPRKLLLGVWKLR